MESELILPHAERYSIDYPEKRMTGKELKAYVQGRLGELHPGFGEKSLWDFTVIKDGEKRRLEAAVLERDFYIEKRLTDRKSRFYITGVDGSKYFLFKANKFDEKGDRKKKRYLWVAAAGLVIILLVFPFFCFTTQGRESEEPEETAVIETVEDAVNVFDAVNQYASVIEGEGGKIKSVSLNAEGKLQISFSVTGCEPYSLVSEMLSLENTAACECENVAYEGGKENFELKAEVRGSQIRQKIPAEIELLELQKYITETLKENGAQMITAGCDSSSGRLSFLLECGKEKLSEANKVMNAVCLSANLFPLSFSEVLGGNRKGVTIRCELICLDESQRIREGNEDERLSLIFDFEEKHAEKVPSQNEKAAPVMKENSEGWKKIGSEVRDGKVFYYYRTAEGKIEVSEENYE